MQENRKENIPRRLIVYAYIYIYILFDKTFEGFILRDVYASCCQFTRKRERRRSFFLYFLGSPRRNKMEEETKVVAYKAQAGTRPRGAVVKTPGVHPREKLSRVNCSRRETNDSPPKCRETEGQFFSLHFLLPYVYSFVPIRAKPFYYTLTRFRYNARGQKKENCLYLVALLATRYVN